VKFLVKLGKNRNYSYGLLTTVYVEDVINQVTLYKWYKAFEEGRESIANKLRKRRPPTSHMEVVKNTAAPIIRQKRRITIRELVT